MKLLWSTIMVRNLDLEMKFLNEVANLKPVTVLDEPRICFFLNGETKLEIIESRDAKDYENLSFGIYERDLTKKRAFVKSLGYNTSPIFSPKPNIKFFFVDSPSGYRLQFVEN